MIKKIFGLKNWIKKQLILTVCEYINLFQAVKFFLKKCLKRIRL